MLAVLYLNGPGTGQAGSMSNVFCAARQILKERAPFCSHTAKEM